MKQYHIACEPGDIGKYVILTGDPGRVEKVASYLENPVFVAENREFVSWNGYLAGEKVTVLSTGIGGPSAAIAVEEAVKCGAHTFIRVGTSGGMALDVKGGDVVVASAAVRQEGTTLHYAPPEYPAVADFSVTEALVAAAREGDRDFHVGVVQSKDSFYGQHEPEKSPVAGELLSKWDAYMKLGVLCSEMECAAIFTVAASLGVRAGAALGVLWNKDRRKRGLRDEDHLETAPALELVVNALEKLIISEK
ncbi:MAG: uridine phosphorylase [Clostridia bacterium]|nr:uridine phosphorylase [Clostridia bacterium]